MKLIIEDDEGRRTIVPLVSAQLTIGRQEGNTIRLLEKNVSRKHARLLRENGRYFIEDLRSFTGVRVNGERIAGRRLVDDGDLIQISEFDLILQAAPGERRPASDGDDDEVTVTAPIKVDSHDAPTEKDASTGVVATAPPRELPAGRRPKLVVTAGALAGKQFTLTHSPVAIGRTAENDVAIEDPSVSRFHCKLFLEGDTWKLLDNRSAHGVKVNGGPCAACRVKFGDNLDIGHVKLRFSAPARAAAGLKLLGLAVFALLAVAVAVAFFVLQRSHNAAPRVAEDEGAQTVNAHLTKARAALGAHRYAEAAQHFEAAQRAGANSGQVRPLREAQSELRDQQALQKLDAAVAARRFDEAKAQLDALGAQPGWFADQMRNRRDAVHAGYLEDHLARAEGMKAQSPDTCASEAQLALAVDPSNARGKSLLEACSAAPARKAPPAQHVARTLDLRPQAEPPESLQKLDRDEIDAQARKLVAEGNQRLLVKDFDGALARFQKGLSLRPGEPVLAALYRSMGITLTHQGNVEEGAHYYRLYLPLCTNPKEREYLKATLEEYEARRR